VIGARVEAPRTGNVGVTSTPPVRRINQPTQTRQTFTSSWHNSGATMAGSRSSPQQEHLTPGAYVCQNLHRVAVPRNLNRR